MANKFKISLLCLAFSDVALAKLVSLEDEMMDGVTGQSGLTIEVHSKTKIDEIQYSDKDQTSGGILDIRGISYVKPYSSGEAAITTYEFDVDALDGLVVKTTYDSTRMKMSDISVGNHRGSALDNYATRQSFGSLWVDYEGTSELKIKGGGSVQSGTGGFIINSQTDIASSDIRWKTNGSTMLIDELEYSATINDMTIDLMDFSGKTGLVFGIPSASFTFSLGALCFASTQNCSATSMGQIDGAMSFRDSYINVFGGGREGAGMTIDSKFVIDEAQPNHFTYTDDSSLYIADISGYIDTKGLTLDIGTNDSQIGDHIAIQVDSIDGLIKADTIEIGGKSLGSAEVRFSLSDAMHDGKNYSNMIKLAPGIAWAGDDFSTHQTLVDAGFNDEVAQFYSGVSSTSDGISIYEEWSRVSDISYNDDGNTINTSNFQAHGSGYTSLDVRNDGTEDYLAIGFVDHYSHYSIDGFRVGKTSDNPRDNAVLQGGTELLLPLGLYPYYDFKMSGNMEMRAGGASGNGLNFNGDMYVTEATFALSTNILSDDRLVGVWADNVTYDYHYRDYTLDVTGNSFKLVQGIKWSNLDIGNLRWGDKDTGDSIGRVRIQAYQTQSTVEFIAGGANGEACAGGTGADIDSCELSGGYWVDKGAEGITIALKQNWEQRSVDGTMANVITWENNRELDVDGNAINGTGTSLTLDNITTNDGYNDTDNNYGLKINLAIDVAQTKVVNKVNPDQEKIMTGASSYTYINTADLDLADKANRPVGFAVAASVQFKELNIETVSLTHPNLPDQPQPIFLGVKMQNFNITSHLTATPIQ